MFYNIQATIIRINIESDTTLQTCRANIIKYYHAIFQHLSYNIIKQNMYISYHTIYVNRIYVKIVLLSE